MPDFVILYNPLAGKRKGHELQRLTARLTEAGRSFTLEEIGREEKATDTAEKAIREGATQLIAAGGDGTISAIGGVVSRHPGVALGILPFGSGNDIARGQGIPLQADGAIDVLLRGNTRRMDVGEVNGIPFLNIASFGFDAAVVEHKTKLPGWIPPHIGYMLSVVLKMFGYREQRMRITTDEDVRTAETLLIAVGIGRYYGGGIEILPHALDDDGLFDVCAIDRVSLGERIRLLPTMQSGAHLSKFDSVHERKAKRVEVELARPSLLNIDGELIPSVGRGVFTLREKALTVIVP